jgi:hypothetical protein
MSAVLPMTSPDLRSLPVLTGRWLIGATLLLSATPAFAWPPLRPPAPPPPRTAPPPPPRTAPAPWTAGAPGANTVYDNDPSNWGPTEAQLAQRCNLGRLVGGLLGGGVGYASSRQEGRTWAVPLGALLGSQVGCNMGAGRGPVPW